MFEPLKSSYNITLFFDAAKHLFDHIFYFNVVMTLLVSPQSAA